MAAILIVSRFKDWMAANHTNIHRLSDLIAAANKGPLARKNPARDESGVLNTLRKWGNREEVRVSSAYEHALRQVTGGASETWYKKEAAASEPPRSKTKIAAQALPAMLSERSSDATTYESLDNRDGGKDNPISEGFVRKVFLDRYSRQALVDFGKIADVSMMGSNMRRIVDQRDDRLSLLIESLRHGRAMRVLMHYPEDGPLCKLAARQEHWDIRIAVYLRLVRKNLAVFCWLRELFPRQLEIKTLPYMPAFGLDVFENAEANVATIHLRLYPLPDQEEANIDDPPLRDRPLIRLTDRDGQWYVFFRRQFELHWGLGKELREYDWRPSQAHMASDVVRLIKDIKIEQSPM